jgi:hypothetical protein
MSNDLEKLSRELIEKGLLIEAGFVSLRMAAMDPAAPPIQVNEMRMAFFAGAQHLFASIMCVLDPSDEPTLKDLARMDAIHKELDRFIHEFQLKHIPTKGNS